MTLSAANSHLVTWKQGFLVYALSSDDEALLERAFAIFRYWQFPGNGATERPAVKLKMRAERAAEGYRFHPSQPPYSQDPASPLPIAPIMCSSIASVIRAAEADSALAVFNHPDDFLTVHGALLAKGNDAVLIVGPSHSGKSTLSCALWASGWQLLADDITIIDQSGNMATPFMRRVSLRHPSRALLGDGFWDKIVNAASCDPTSEGYMFHPDEIEGRSRARSVCLRTIIFLQRLGAPTLSPGRFQLISPVQALLSLAPYTNIIRHSDLGVTMQRLGPIINSISSYDLARAPLPEMVAVLESLVPGEATIARSS